ncbi:hypothetical protein quinque_008498 [Culex quinquefasciatus]
MEFVKKLSKKQLFQHSYKDPSEYFASLLVLPNKITGVAGLDVLSPDFKRFTPNLIGLVLTYVMFAGVSFSTIVEVRDDVDDLIYCLVTLGMGMQGLMKIFTFLLARDELVWIQEYSKRLFREEGIAHKCLIMNNILLMNVVTKLILVFYAFTTVFMLVAPMFITLTTDHKLLTSSVSGLPWVRSFLHAVQQPVSLSMIFYPLNMPTFQSLMNTIYSYLTLLLTFRDE